MNIKTLLLLLILALPVVGHGQSFDLIEIDSSVTPSPTHVRIKFTSPRYSIKQITEVNLNTFPPTTYIKFVFNVCDDHVGIPSYFDTTLQLVLGSPYRLKMWTVLEANTTDTTCIIRPAQTTFDSVDIRDPGQLGIGGFEKGDPVSIYPNPTEGIFQVRLNNTALGIEAVKVFDLAGRIIRVNRIASASYSFPQDAAKGMYLVGILLNDGRFIRQQMMLQ